MNLPEIIEAALGHEKIKRCSARYLVQKPDLDDVRIGFARVTSRGKIVWIPRHKLKKKQRIILYYANLAQAMINPIRRRLNYQSIGRKVFSIEEMPSDAHPIY